jgi:hypothetical protein
MAGIPIRLAAYTPATRYSNQLGAVHQNAATRCFDPEHNCLYCDWALRIARAHSPAAKCRPGQRFEAAPLRKLPEW